MATRTAWQTCAIGIVLTIAACGPAQHTDGAAPRTPAAGPAAINRFIVSFHVDPVAPGSPAFLTDLSTTSGVTLRYVRRLGPSVHLFATSEQVDSKTREEIIARLSKRKDIRYIEYDWPMHHMKSGRQQGSPQLQ